MNNIVRRVLCCTVPTDSAIIEDYFDNEVYDAKTGFREGWLPYCEYDKVIKTDTGGIEVGDFVLFVANPHNISLNTMIYQMSHHDVFMRYFMERLKRNIQKVIIHNNLEPY